MKGFSRRMVRILRLNRKAQKKVAWRWASSEQNLHARSDHLTYQEMYDTTKTLERNQELG